MPVGKPIFSINALTFQVSDIVKSFTKCIADGEFLLFRGRVDQQMPIRAIPTGG
jgi:hypothetical protein